MKRVAIIGGGAAGLAAGVALGKAARDASESLEITIYELDAKVGKSILRSGNGRCNFSNVAISANKYTNAAFVSQAFAALSPKEVLAFFDELGLTWQEENEGRLMPSSRKASSVLNVLRSALDEYGVVESCGVGVQGIEVPSKRSKCYTLRMADGVFNRADAVIVAVGGHDGLTLLPHKIRVNDLYPTLGPLKTSGSNLRGLDNIRVRGEVTLVPLGSKKNQRPITESGEIMFRKYGVSGIAVFNLSRYARVGDMLNINLFPQVPAAALPVWLQLRAEKLQKTYAKLRIEDVLRGMLLEQLVKPICEAARVDAQQNVQKTTTEQWQSLAAGISCMQMVVEGSGDETLCQVSRGGVLVGQVQPTTMEVAAQPGLYVVGEALDVDAPCGGYNLHWAWTSGLLAGRAAAKSLLR